MKRTKSGTRKTAGKSAKSLRAPGPKAKTKRPTSKAKASKSKVSERKTREEPIPKAAKPTKKAAKVKWVVGRATRAKQGTDIPSSTGVRAEIVPPPGSSPQSSVSKVPFSKPPAAAALPKPKSKA